MSEHKSEVKDFETLVSNKESGPDAVMKPWQIPKMEEMDYTETRSGTCGGNLDGAGYS